MRENLRILTLCLAVVFSIVGHGSQAHAAEGDEEIVIKADDDFQTAKQKNDVAALDRILAENFYETNQNGNSRDKEEFLKLFQKFPIKSLMRDAAQVRLTGNTAIVTGMQTEQNASGTDRMLFMRVWVKDTSGWRLAGSMQSRSPR